MTRESALISPAVPSAKGKEATGRGTTGEQALVSPSVTPGLRRRCDCGREIYPEVPGLDGSDHI